MENSIETAVRRAIHTMRENLGEDLTVDDLARAAMFSKFHFTRIFQRTTGLSPGRFLSALRLQHAKHLLVSTSMNVADISISVGYHSVGTFSSRFSRSVGMSPTAYRRMAGYANAIRTDTYAGRENRSGARMNGYVSTVDRDAELIFIGLFPTPIPEGRPVRCAILPRSGTYDFTDIPPGSWHLLAQSVSSRAGARVPAGEDQGIAVATHGPVTVRAATRTRIDLELNPLRELDPPVLLALLDVRKLVLTDEADPRTDRRQSIGAAA